MSTIDTSGIDASKPILGNPTTKAVRDNFAEIIVQLNNAATDIDAALTLDAVLVGMEGVTINANQIHYATGLNTYDVTSLTDYGRTVIGASDAGDFGVLGDHVTLSSIGTPTYNTVQQNIDSFHSAGLAVGLHISDGGGGVLDVAAGSGYIRAVDSDVSTLYAFDLSAVVGLVLTDQEINYIYIEYNAGSPQVVATIIKRSDLHTNVFLGNVYRDGTTLHINEYRAYDVGDHASKMISRLLATAPMAHESGASLTETGTRNIQVTAGNFWEGFNSFATSLFDSSVADTYSYFYDDGASGWTEVTAQTQIDNLQYDDGTGVLATLGNAKYGVHWVYLATDSDVYVVYGTGSYSLAEAQDAQPSAVPPHIESHGRLVGKVVIQKSAAIFYSAESAFDVSFSGAGVNDHANLTNIGVNTHTQIDAHLADTTNAHQWVTSGNDIYYNTGNVVIGSASPDAWGSNYDVVQLGSRTNLMDFVSTFLSNNVYNDNASWIYQESAAATLMQMTSSGKIEFRVAPSGSAGGSASFTTALTINVDENIGIHDTNPGVRLVVKDDGAINPTVARIIQDDNNVYGLMITNDSYDTGYSGLSLKLDNSGNGEIVLPSLASNTLSFKAGSGVVQSFIIKDDGVVGVGFNTPEAWHASFAVLEVGGNSGIYCHETEQTNAAFNILENAYFSAGSQYVYKTTDEASHYQMNAGQHRFEVAPSGTVGTNISFVRALTLDALGNATFGAAVAEAWSSSWNAIQLGGNAAFWSNPTAGAGRELNLGINVYDDGTEKFIATDEATNYKMQNGVHTFNVSASGAIDTAIIWSKALEVDSLANVSIGAAALATTATDGFLYIPTCAGAPTGIPSGKTGRVPLIFDTTNNNLYVYDGSWISVALA